MDLLLENSNAIEIKNGWEDFRVLVMRKDDFIHDFVLTCSLCLGHIIEEHRLIPNACFIDFYSGPAVWVIMLFIVFWRILVQDEVAGLIRSGELCHRR